MNKLNRILWGIVFILAGAALAAKAFGLTNFDLFFDGWWTLFIIIPCAVDFFTKRDKWNHLAGVALGVVLLLCCQEVLSFHMLWQLIVPVALLFIGGKMLFGALFRKSAVTVKRLIQDGRPIKHASAVFSGIELDLAGETVEGADLTAVFGGLEYDLRNAVFTGDCAIRATAVFGGIDLRLPPDVNVKVTTASVFGGVENKASKQSGTVTVYVTATALFGGIDIL